MKYFISLLLLVSFISCNKDDSINLNQTEADIIKYIEDNNLDAERSDLGVYYVIDTQGYGKTPTHDAYVKVDYRGYFLDGKEFDQTDSEGVYIDLLSVIPGFSDGLTFFNEGGKGSILIPPSLAFGNVSTESIPGGAVLIFDVEILEVMNPQSEDDIIEYLDENNLDAERSETGLYYIIEDEGSGDLITDTSTVTVVYNGYLLNGIEFDASDENGAKFNLQNVVPGFAEGITYFNVGGKGTLLIPPSLAYGSEGYKSVPRNVVLIFEIDIKSLDN